MRSHARPWQSNCILTRNSAEKCEKQRTMLKLIRCFLCYSKHRRACRLQSCQFDSWWKKWTRASLRCRGHPSEGRRVNEAEYVMRNYLARTAAICEHRNNCHKQISMFTSLSMKLQASLCTQWESQTDTAAMAEDVQRNTLEQREKRLFGTLLHVTVSFRGSSDITPFIQSAESAVQQSDAAIASIQRSSEWSRANGARTCSTAPLTRRCMTWTLPVHGKSIV